MISLANLRASSAPWLFLPALLYMSVYIGGNNPTGVPGYGTSSGELAAWGVAVIAPAVAGAAAWEAGRHRRLGQLREVGGRSPIRQFLWAALPVFVLQLCLIAGALVLARSTVGVWPSGHGLLGVAHLVVLPWGWMVVGWVLGLLCPRAVAAPIAAVGSWAFLAMPHTMHDPSWRHLGGFVTEGSTLTDLLDPLVYVIPWVVVAGFAVAAVLLVKVHRRPWLIIVSVMIIVGTLVIGRDWVSGWGYSPLTQPRIGHDVCVDKSPSVCVPEEYAKDAGDVRADSLPRLRALRAAGLPYPQVLLMASRDLPLKPGTWPLEWSPEMSGEQLDDGFSASAVAGVAALHGVRDCGQPSIADTWAMLVVGVSKTEAQRTLAPDGWAQLQRVRSMPIAQQAAWFTEAVDSQRYCA